MYDSNHYLIMFYVSLNVLLETLSFRMTIAFQPLGLLFLIKTVIKDLETVSVNSITCELGALYIIHTYLSIHRHTYT